MCQTIWEKIEIFLGKCSLLEIKKQKNKNTVHVAFNKSKHFAAAAAKSLQWCPILMLGMFNNHAKIIQIKEQDNLINISWAPPVCLALYSVQGNKI